MKASQRVILTVLMLAMAGGNGCECEDSDSSSSAGAGSALSTASQTLTRTAAIVAAEAGLPLPMLTDFPTCQSTLNTGSSRENIQLGALGTTITGSATCFTVNNPIQLDVTEGSVQITIEAAAVALPAPVSAMRVAQFAIEGRSLIAGGTASTNPIWSIEVGYRYPHSGSPTGTEPIAFGATLIDADNLGGGTPLPALASVTIDCGVGTPTVLPVNEGVVDIPVEATSVCGTSCACTASATLSGGASASAGEAVQRLTVYAFNTNGLCGSNETCRQADPTQPFCVADFGCSNGSIGMPCDHESQCDRASGVICDSAGLCKDGSAGASCARTGDCIAGLGCVSSTCRTL